MKLSTKIRYGVRAMIDIGAHCSDRPVPLTDVSKRQNVSAKYLEAIMPSLKASELVRSVKGPGGGYSLARRPGEITLYDIFSALEGPACLVDCVNQPENCRGQSSCVSYDIWKNLSHLINSSLKSVTIGDLIDRQNQRESKARETLMYNI